MVEIKDDPYSAPSSSVLDENAKQQPRKLWPYLLLSLAAAFVGVGVHHLHNSSPLGMCPFHMFSTYTNSEVLNHVCIFRYSKNNVSIFLYYTIVFVINLTFIFALNSVF